jgi:MoaA/NifB/PqqE/SkfB family radical SAM enzyme
MRACNNKLSKKMFRSLVPSYIKSRFHPRPVWAHLYVTRKCNLSCSYCFVKDNHREQLDTQGMKEAIDKLHSLGCRFLAFLGGEPTIRPDLFDLIGHASARDMITHVSTNGTMLSPAYIDSLIDAGTDIVNLSVDSVLQYDESKKDFARSSEVLVNLLKARERKNFEITVNLVLTSKNAATALTTIARIHDMRIPISIGLIIPGTHLGAATDESLLFRTENEIAALDAVVRTIKTLKQSGYSIIEPESYFDDIQKFVRGRADWYCAAGKYYMSVDCDGRFQFCGSLPPEDFTVFDLDKNYYSKLRTLRKSRLCRCKKECLSNCVYDTSYFIKHPAKFFLGTLAG